MIDQPYELPQADAEIHSLLGLQTIGFVQIRSNGKIIEDPKLLGSGTLIRTPSGEHGILTAAHVLELVKRDTPVGLHLFLRQDNRHQFKLEFEPSDCILTPDRASDDALPDLAFLRVHEPRVSDLKAYGCVFYSLQRQRLETAIEDAKSGRQQNFVVGVVGQSLTRRHDESTGQTITGHSLLFGESSNYSVVGKDGFMLSEQIVSFGPQQPPPSSYGGMSGGGFWMLTWPKGEAPQKISRTLLGTIIQQTRMTEDGRKIVCHILEDTERLLLSMVADQITK
ncbi:MAG: hypothetical protein JJ911_07520 [Rhizobiaceae bacterium]|nr:hypothetical protein [Rhizobiaceae bacterium]